MKFTLIALPLLVSLAVGLDQAAAAGPPVVTQGAWADSSELTSGDRSTTLQVVAHQTSPGPNPLTYRWVKAGGPPGGRVAFFPNGSDHADTTTATFSGHVAGVYTLRVIVTDGLDETVSEVEVSIDLGQSPVLRARPEPGSPGMEFRTERPGAGAVYTRVGRAIVRFETDDVEGTPTLSAASLAVMDSLGATLLKTRMHGRFGVIELAPGVDEDAVLDALSALPEIRYAEPDHSVELDAYVPNDPQFDAQWNLENAADVDINATLAWDQSTGSTSTLVAVMDSGVEYTHPDLYLAIAINNAEIPASLMSQLIDTDSNGSIDFYDLNSLDANGDLVLDGGGAKFNETLAIDQNGNGYIDAGDLRVPAWFDGVDDDANGYVDDLTGWDSLNDSSDSLDTDGHGTHVTGIIAAQGDNGIGIAGVNWRTRILPEQFHDGDGGSVSDAIQAIEHAVLLGADVINASWGTFADNQALEDAVAWAGDNGAVFVAAAGNHGNDIGDPLVAYYPAAYDLPNLISVASVDLDGSLSVFSSYGPTTVDLGAPGSNILSTGLGGSYLLRFGTSMSTSHVSGVVSLLAGIFPSELPDWLVDRVLESVRPLPSLEFTTITGGMVDAFAAVNTPGLLAGPRILMATPIGDVSTPTSGVLLTFDSAMSVPTFTTNDVAISGPSGPVNPTAVNMITDFEFEVTFPEQTAVGTYTLDVGPDIEDTLARAMDQDRDGVTAELLDDRFSLVFRQLPPPTTWVIDDGDAGYSTIGSWITFNGAGAQGDFDYKTVGSGTDTATWTLSGLTAGQFQVSVTWDPFSNRAVDAPYTVLNGATGLETVPVDQTQAPADFVENGIAWQNLGLYQITGDTLVVELSDLAGPSGSLVIADAVRVERVGDPVAGPEIRVLVDGVEVADGTGSVAFGTTEVGAPVAKTITVHNVGTADLTLGTITLPIGFSELAGFGSTLLIPGETTDFVVQMDALVEGTPAGVVSFDSNDADENPFDFTVSGTVLAELPAIWVIDDGDAGYSTVGSWITFNGVGAQGDFDYKTVGSGLDAASWTLSGLTAGQFQVSVTWEPFGNRAVDALYTVLDGATGLETLQVDQTLAPTDFVENGIAWHDLGIHLIVGGTLVVELSDLAGPPASLVVADAVRVERVAGPVVAQEIRVVVDGVGVPDGTGSVGFGTTVLGAPLAKTITVHNVGLAELTLGAITLPAGFSEIAGFGTTSLNPGQSTDFVVQMDALVEGTPAGVVSFDSNDADENPFDFNVSGTVLAELPAIWVIDDGDAGYSTLGSWTTFNGAGAQGDFDFKTVGSGLDSATWGLSGLTAGQFQVSVTWEPFGNRAVDAPYTVLDGPTGLETVLVDQTQAPADFVENGIAWQDLGVYQIAGDTLVVELSDLASPLASLVIADAVRVERVGDPVLGPDIRVVVDGVEVADGTGSVAFGVTPPGAPVAKTIAVINVGTADLTLGTVTLPAGFSELAGFGTTLLVPGQTTDFVVQLDALVVGAFGGVIGFDSNDPDENPFAFNVSGRVGRRGCGLGFEAGLAVVVIWSFRRRRGTRRRHPLH